MESLATAVALAVLAASVWLWSVAWQRWRRGRPWVVSNVPAAVPWGLVDLGLAAAIFLLVQGIMAALISTVPVVNLSPGTSAPNGEDQRRWLLLSAATTVMVCLATAGALRLRHHVSLRELGWSRIHFSGDLALGAMAFAMLAPVVYGIQRLLTYFIDSEHPLIELIRRNPRLDFFLAAFIAAAVVAPLTEEFLFRVLIQGWLERLFTRPMPPSETLMMGGRLPGDLEPVPAAARERMRFGPIGVSSLLFALAHWSHGPDPIPLFVLAVGLGYLYHRTGRIVPCIVVHVLLNVTSLFALWLIVTGGK